MESRRGSPYQPLEQSQRHFRLLRLRECGTSQMQFELKTFSLLDEDLPPWRALSYRWGEDVPESTVHLNGHPVLVRKGLHGFLTQMNVDQDDWYFIDALCIDQKNDSERSSQVQQMRQIYQQAEEVVVWLVYEPYHIDDEDDVAWVVYDLDKEGQDVSSLSREQLEDAVLENSYWSRLWIVQEVLLAKKLAIRIGSAEVEWSNLSWHPTEFKDPGLPTRNSNIFSNAIRQHRSSPNANLRTAYDILSYRRFRTKALRSGYHLPFHRAVELFSMQRCSRPHDIVFGYLGLTKSRIRTDYSIPILDLFIATLADYLLSMGFVGQYPAQINHKEPWDELDRPIMSPPIAFGLDPNEPVVHLLVLEVTKLLAPGFEERLADVIMIPCWVYKQHASGVQNILNCSDDERKLESNHVSKAVPFKKTIKKSELWAAHENIVTRLKELKEEDAVMPAPGESAESKTYSQWAAHAKAISEQIHQRFIEACEYAEAEDDLDDESWTLTA